MTFDPTKPCTTRDGREVRLFTERMKDGRLVGILTNNGNESVLTWQRGGNYYQTGDSKFDLINTPVKRTVWLNFYKSGGCSKHDNRGDADSFAGGPESARRIACVKVEFKEGEGL